MGHVSIFVDEMRLDEMGLDKMGHVSIFLDEMRLDKMGLDEMDQHPQGYY